MFSFSSSIRSLRHDLSCSARHLKTAAALAREPVAGPSTAGPGPAQILRNAKTARERHPQPTGTNSSRTSTLPKSSLSPRSNDNENRELLSQERETPIAYLKHRAAMKSAFPSGWNPPRKLSREAMVGLRALHVSNPALFTTPMLAEKFRISPEAVRRILRAKWVPKGEERLRMVRKERERRAEWIRRSRDAEGERRAVGKWERKAEEADSIERQEKMRDGLTFR